MKIVFLSLLVLLIVIQFIPVKKSNPPIDENMALKAPEDVMKLLKKSCYDCHSNETKWPWYSAIAPLSWSIVSHVNNGRKALNFSNYKKIDKNIKIKRLKRAIKTRLRRVWPIFSKASRRLSRRFYSPQKMRIKKKVS